MCGFLMYERFANNQKPLDLINEMSYRGLPEFVNTKKFRDHIFCHTALPFVNLDPKYAIQPIKSSVLPFLFVGEVFNWKEIADKYGFNCSTDGELFDHIIRNKFELIHELDGFWTYAGVRQDKPFYITDYLSQKPLYYRTDVEAAASELDVLKNFGEVTPDKTYLSNVLKWGYDPSGRTPWEEIRQLKPGHISYDGHEKNYWDWSKVEEVPLRDALIESTRLRLGGQRDVSILLSGGLDSSVIYGIISKELGRDVTAFHVENGEEQYAKMVTTDYISVKLDKVDDTDAIRIHQCPVDLGSLKPQIAMARKLKEYGFNAVMTGDGADELFGGYNRAKEYDSQYSDVFCELPYYHLPKLDRTMMDSTIEVRSPFLAPSVVKYALGLPWEERKGIKKAIMETFADLVPEAILNRAKHPLKTDAIRKDPMLERLKNNEIWRKLNA